MNTIKVNLRKASAIVSKIDTAIAALARRLDVSVNINVWDTESAKDFGEVVDQSRTNLQETIRRLIALEEAKSTIRALVNDKNQAKITKLIEQRVAIKNKLKLFGALASQIEATSRNGDMFDTVMGAYKKAVAQRENGDNRTSWMSNSTVGVTLADKEMTDYVQNEIRSLQNVLASIEEKLIAENISTEVEIPSDVITAEKLI